MIEENPDNKNDIKESLSVFSSSVKDPCGEQSSWSRRSDDAEEVHLTFFCYEILHLQILRKLFLFKDPTDRKTFW